MSPQLSAQITYEVHEHIFVSGPRSKSGTGRDGKWHSCGEHIRHSHPGGSKPHSHPDTGPSFYGYRKPKVTNRATGEQFELIPVPEEDQSFDLVITDSALMSTRGGLVPIGNTPIEEIGMAAAEAVICGSRLKCIVRDEREQPWSEAKHIQQGTLQKPKGRRA